MALSTITLIKSTQKSFCLRVSTLIANPPCLIPVKAKTLPTTVSTLKIFCEPLQYSMLVTKFEIRFHISKSRFLPCRIFPSEFFIKIPVQALKVENSYMKLRKNILSNGYPESLEMASTSATKSLCINTFLAYHQTPLQNDSGMGNLLKSAMNLAKGTLKSSNTCFHLTQGESSI